VFVDDLERNIAAAEELGMTGVLHRSPDETIAALAELLGLAPEVLETAP
jgi:putative hydrolase of the HAD superfamily